MQPHRVVPAAGLVLALTVTACSSTVNGSGALAPPSSTPSAAGLAASLQAGVVRLASGHFELRGTVNGRRITGTGDQTLDNGRLTGLSAQATLPIVGNVGVIVDSRLRYVKVPTPPATAGRPWIRVSPNSTNPLIRQFDRVLDSAFVNGNLGRIVDQVRAASSVRRVGSASVNGTPATRYAVTVDPTRLRNPAPAGTAPVAVDVWLDGQNRPLQVHSARSVAGRTADVTVTFSKFDAPVRIAAPPASQIAPS